MKKSTKQTKWGPIVAEPIAPKQPEKKRKKPVCPEMTERKVRALQKFLDNGDIDTKTFWKIKDRLIAEMVGEQ
jgi:hypothetical protein